MPVKDVGVEAMLGRHDEAIPPLHSAIDILQKDFLCFPTNPFHGKELLMLNLHKAGLQEEAEDLFKRNAEEQRFFGRVGLNKNGEWI